MQKRPTPGVGRFTCPKRDILVIYRRMKRRIFIYSIIIIVLAVVVFGLSAWIGHTSWSRAQEDQINTILDQVNDARLSEASDTVLEDQTKIHVLFLGLDARKEDENPHCDAIHLFTLDLENWAVQITTVPRGTYAYIPRALEPAEYYLANACSYEGLEYGIEQIEKVAGMKADYVVTVNFSQTLGILRLFDLPTTETLQWLRHRQSYQIGEPQRAHNQAVFMKDMLIEHLGAFESDFTLPMQYLLYSFVDTDMDFSTAQALLHGFINAHIEERPDDIVLVMRPYYETVDYHYDPETIETQIEDWVEFLRPYLSSEDLSELSLEDIQASIIHYMRDAIESGASVELIVDGQLWLQIEDDQTREELHYAMMEAYVQKLEDPDAIIDVLSLYILEKETLELDEWAQKGKALLATMVE